MSLSALNSPSLVTTAGVGLGYALPIVQDFVIKSPWSTVRIANLISFGINFTSVSRPGRLDGEAAQDGQLSPRNGKTLVAPAGWAFAIWGPIFLGEAIGVATQFFISENDPIVNLLKETSGPFIVAQLFQSLWCAAFRPKYNENKMFVSVGMLSGTAFCLSKAHNAFASSSARTLYSPWQYGVFFFPMALHFGWTTAASLVNLNGAIAMKKNTTEKVIALVGHASVAIASVLGVVLSLERNAPVCSGVIAWALFAVADSMKRRLEAKDSGDKKRKLNIFKKKVETKVPFLYGASTQRILSKTGAIMNVLSTAALSAMLVLKKDSKSTPTP
jgi:hypothetical protein